MKAMRRLLKWYEKKVRPGQVARALGGILGRDYGHDLSVRRGEPVDRNGKPMPWFTYPAIEYVEQLDFSKKSVFEFGAGNSTFFWCERAARVTSVEHNPEWHQRIKERLPENGHLTLVQSPSDYAGEIERTGGRFDVIVIDGIERRACCATALKCLAPGGLIILDNSDWHHLCAKQLRDGGLLEVDMSGFGPINDYTWTTSFFFHREFAFEGRRESQPGHGMGSLPQLEQP